MIYGAGNTYCRSYGNPVPTKNLGNSCTSVSNPVNPGTGNKYQTETDFLVPGQWPLRFQRYYNKGAADDSQSSWYFGPDWFTQIGSYWRHSFDRSVNFLASTDIATAFAYRPDGKVLPFNLYNGQYRVDADVSDALQKLTDASNASTAWRYTTADDEIELYDATGKLLSITNRAGLTQSLSYSDGTSGSGGGYVLDANGNPTAIVLPAGLLIRVTDASGRSLNFGYDAASRIVK